MISGYYTRSPGAAALIARMAVGAFFVFKKMKEECGNIF
jgi:hypothetical protein